jgi:hypothetical protein
MKSRMMIWMLGAAALAASGIASMGTMAMAQAPSPLLPPQLEKDLAARASNVTEVTLDKSMLGFASKFMDRKDKNQAAVNELIQGLDGIYVRSYEFDKEGQYSMDDIEKVRQAFTAPEWSPMVHERELKSKETTDVMMKLVNGEPHGMFVLSAEPKELTIVLILGPIRMDQLGELSGIGGLGALGDVEKKGQQRKAEKALEKAKEQSDKKDGDQ